MPAQSWNINGRFYRYEVRLVDGKWKPVRLEGHHVLPGDEIFRSYEDARAEARRRNRVEEVTKED